MHILSQLEKPKFKVTKSDKIIINYLQTNLDQFAFKSITEVAHEINVGEATISRFTRKMGFKNLSEFKVNLSKEVAINNNRSIIDENIIIDESIMESVMKLLTTNIHMLENTVEIIDIKLINKTVSLIINAKKVYFIGMGYSGIIAEDSNYKFMRIGMNCISLESSHIMAMMASLMSEGDLVIAISNSGETEEIIKTVELARKNNAKIISVTGNNKSRLENLSDVSLHYITKETKLETGSIASKLAQMFLIDVVYVEIVKKKLAEATERKIKTTNAINLFSEN